MLQVSLILQVKENELIIKGPPIMVPNIASGKYIYLSLFVCFCFYFYVFFYFSHSHTYEVLNNKHLISILFCVNFPSFRVECHGLVVPQ